MRADRSVEYYWESCLHRFERVMKLMEGDSKPAVKHREELFGTANEYAYPDLFNMISSGKELLSSYPEFKDMVEDPKRLRLVAQMIAQHRLQNIVEILHRHEGIVRRNEDKLKQKENKAAAKSKSKGRRR